MGALVFLYSSRPPIRPPPRPPPHTHRKQILVLAFSALPRKPLPRGLRRSPPESPPPSSGKRLPSRNQSIVGRGSACDHGFSGWPVGRRSSQARAARKKGRLLKGGVCVGAVSPSRSRLLRGEELPQVRSRTRRGGGGAKTGAPWRTAGRPWRLANHGTRARVCSSRPVRRRGRGRGAGGRVQRAAVAFSEAAVRPRWRAQISGTRSPSPRAQSRGREEGERVRVLRVLGAGNTGAPGRRLEETEEM